MLINGQIRFCSHHIRLWKTGSSGICHGIIRNSPLITRYQSNSPNQQPAALFEKWRSIHAQRFNELIQNQDSKGVYNELTKLSDELLISQEVSTTSKLGAIAATLCIDEQKINYELACNIFDIVNDENSQVTQSGYEKLLDLCLYKRQAFPIPFILNRMKGQGLSLALPKYEAIIKYLLSHGKLSEVVELTSSSHPLTHSLMLASAEPFFLSGQYDQYFNILSTYLHQNQNENNNASLTTDDISNILISIVWAWGRSSPAPLRDSDIVNSRLIEIFNFLSETHSQNVEFLQDLNLAKIAFTEMLYPSQSFYSSQYLIQKAEAALAQLRWKFLSSSKYHSFPYLKQKFLIDEDPSLVMQINDLTVQLSNPQETLESNKDYTLQQTITKSTMERYSNVLLSKSFWPQGYLGELQTLVDVENDSDETDDDDDDDDDEDDDEDSDNSSDEDEDDEDVLTDMSVQGDADSDSDGNSNSDSSDQNDTSDSNDSFEEIVVYVTETETDTEESNPKSKLSHQLNHTPQKLRHLEAMYSLGCATTTRSLPGLDCSDLTKQFETMNQLSSTPPVLFASSLFNEYISMGVPFIAETITNKSALEEMVRRFNMSDQNTTK